MPSCVTCIKCLSVRIENSRSNKPKVQLLECGLLVNNLCEWVQTYFDSIRNENHAVCASDCDHCVYAAYCYAGGYGGSIASSLRRLES